MSKLIIVESPTKAKTISKFLDNKYVVASSYGHIRDLPKGELGIDVEKNFEPRYVIPTKAKKKLSELKKELKNVDEIILATDEDREGEAIAWHLVYALDLNNIKNKATKDKMVERIVFHEITKDAIEAALKNPRDINMDLVDAQQARRVLDRLVGYKLSPFLWKKVMRGLSAGRVQSVAVRLIVEKEREIKKFKPEEYWSIEALLQTANASSRPKQSETDKQQITDFTALLWAKREKSLDKFAVKNKKEANNILNTLKEGEWKIKNIRQKEVKKNPLPPFTTSTLQQTAGNRFGYSAKRTMMLAQNLYERGFITYHRTDSLSIASIAITASRAYIKKELGKNYLPASPRVYKTKSKNAQEAHEAIRPTDPARTPGNLKLENPQKKIYELIWQRFLASQILPAVFASTTVDIATKTDYTFRASGHTMRFAGYLKIYPTKFKEAELPELKEGELLKLKKLKPNQHFTKPPARYSEASLIKELEKNGIGRPSTYAPTISTIQDRNYVQKNEQKRLEPSELGFIVTDMLAEHFPNIVDYAFTAGMEKSLDNIADGKVGWQKIIEEFYSPFEKNLEQKYEEVEKKDLTEKTNRKCPECAKELLIRMGRFGKFYACSGFPECKYTENIKAQENKLDVNCPKCVEGLVIEKKTRRGKIFFGCSRYPDCDFATWYKPVIENIKGTTKKTILNCPKCKSVLVEKPKARACSNKECTYKITN